LRCIPGLSSANGADVLSTDCGKGQGFDLNLATSSKIDTKKPFP
jgi:hypothetical protein